MKKFFAMMLCVIMLISAAAVAETYNATLTLADGTSYSGSFGLDEAGDIVILVNDIPSLGTVGIQLGSEVAYISAYGMTVSIEYATLADQLTSLTGDTGDTDTAISIDDEAIAELVSTLGADLATLIVTETTDAGTSITMNFSFAQLWDAAGADLTAWMSAHADMVDQLLEAAEVTDVTTDLLIESLNALDPSQIDFSQTFELSVVNGESLMPQISLNGAWTYAGASIAEISGALDDQALTFKVASSGADVVDIVLAYTATDTGLTTTLTSMGEQLLTADIAITDGAMDAITDGSDAMDIGTMLPMIMSMSGASAS